MTTYQVNGYNKFNGNPGTWTIKTDGDIEKEVEDQGIKAEKISVINSQDVEKNQIVIYLYEVAFINQLSGKENTRKVETISEDAARDHFIDALKYEYKKPLQIISVKIINDSDKIEQDAQDKKDIQAILSNPTDDELLYEMDINNCDEITLVEGMQRNKKTYKKPEIGKYNASLAAKKEGLPSLKVASEIIGESTQTLNNWFNDNRFVFDSVIHEASEQYNKKS